MRAVTLPRLWLGTQKREGSRPPRPQRFQPNYFLAPDLKDRDSGDGQVLPRLGSHLMLFMLSINFTDQGRRTIKDAAKRVQAARDMTKKLGVEIKQIYLASGESDLITIVDAPNGDHVAKVALALGSTGNVRTRMARLWSEAEYLQLVSELP